MTELDFLRDENARLRDLLDVSTRTLERVHKRVQNRVIVHCGGCDACRTSPVVKIDPSELAANQNAPEIYGINPEAVVREVPLEDGGVLTIQISGIPNDRPLYACSHTGMLLRIADTIDGGTLCKTHRTPCCLVGYERIIP